MPDSVSINVAQTAEERRRIQASSADLTTYPHVSVVVATDPDNVSAVVAGVDVTAGAPCWLDAARLLREIADQLEQRHGDGPCQAQR